MPQPLKIGDSLDVIEVTRTNYPNDWKVGDVLLAEKDPELSGYEVKSKVHDMYLYYGCGMYYIINAASFHVYELQNLRKMTLSDIKKWLYKSKPTATRFAYNGKEIFYDCILSDIDNDYQVFFIIPDEEAFGFSTTEPAQLLIRWLQPEFNTL